MKNKYNWEMYYKINNRILLFNKELKSKGLLKICKWIWLIIDSKYCKLDK